MDLVILESKIEVDKFIEMKKVDENLLYAPAVPEAVYRMMKTDKSFRILEDYTSQVYLDTVGEENFKLMNILTDSFMQYATEFLNSFPFDIFISAEKMWLKRYVDSYCFRYVLLKNFIRKNGVKKIICFKKSETELDKEQALPYSFIIEDIIADEEFKNIQLETFSPVFIQTDFASLTNVSIKEEIQKFIRSILSFILTVKPLKKYIRARTKNAILLVDEFYSTRYFADLISERHKMPIWCINSAAPYRYPVYKKLLSIKPMKNKNRDLKIINSFGQIIKRFNTCIRSGVLIKYPNLTKQIVKELHRHFQIAVDIYNSITEFSGFSGIVLCGSSMLFELSFITLLLKKRNPVFWYQHGAFGYFDVGDYFKATAFSMSDFFIFWGPESVRYHKNIEWKNKNKAFFVPDPELFILYDNIKKETEKNQSITDKITVAYIPDIYRADFRWGPHFSFPDIKAFLLQIEIIKIFQKFDTAIRKIFKASYKDKFMEPLKNFILELRRQDIEFNSQPLKTLLNKIDVFILEAPATAMYHACLTDKQIIWLDTGVYDISEVARESLEKRVWKIDYNTYSWQEELYTILKDIIEKGFSKNDTNFREKYISLSNPNISAQIFEKLVLEMSNARN
ncbi:MAG: hypothetical protein AB1349_01945 [Elusimicrobiota bacterium]